MPTMTYPAPPAGLERKSASASPEGGLIEADDATGVVEAIVSITGLLDEDRDVIKPGAYAKTLAKRKPKGIFAHDWAKWVARTEEIVELMPGDARLPKTTKDGRPWPREAGGLYVKCRFNLETEAGRDAYSNVKFYSETGEQEWSVGYKVPPGKSTRTKSGERHIEEMDLFEYSPVLFGAATLSGTLSVKSAGAGEEGQYVEEEDQGTAFADDALQAQEELDDLAARFLAEDWENDEDSEGKTLFDLDAPPLGDPLDVFREFRDLQVPDISDEAMRERVHAALFRLDRALIAGDRSQAAVAVDVVLSQLRDAGADPVIHSFTRGPAAPLLRRAGEALEVPFMKGGAMGGKRMGVGLDRSPRANWVEKAGGLPPYIEEIAKSIHQKRGVPLDRAIPIAVAQVKKLAANPGADPDTRAKAVKALAQWEALKTRAHAMSAGKSAEGDGQEMVSSRYPFLPDTYEELRERLREALSDRSSGAALVEVVGTWDDSVVAVAYGMDGKAQAYEAPYRLRGGDLLLGEPVPVDLKVTVEGAEEDGADLLPYPAVLEEVAVDLKALLVHSGAESKAGRVLSAVNEKRLLAAVESLVAVLRAAGLEVDAAPRVRQEEQERDLSAEAAQYQDSTAPSGRVGSKVILDPALLERSRKLLAGAGAAAG